MYPKKAEMGVGTLIVFIAMLLVAAVAAGVLIQTTNSMQEKSLATGQQAKGQISTNVRVVEVSGKDASDGYVDEFMSIMKIAPGSDPIKLDGVLYSESTDTTSSNLQFRTGALPIQDPFHGYFTASGYPFTNRSDSFEHAPSNDFYNYFNWYETSEMMIGKIAVNIIFVESNGSVDANFENWTFIEQETVINDTRDALNWWSNIEPRANIHHTFNIYRDVPISYEPVTRNTNETNQQLWMNESLDYIGAPAGDPYMNRIALFNHNTRIQENAHWAFTFFVVDGSETGTGFIDGNAGIAYINGPHTFISTGAWGGLNRDALLAHEFAHIFGARDQYAAVGCTCLDTGGHYNIENQNCIADTCVLNTTSLMRSGMETINSYNSNTVDVFALAQMGLIDENENNLLDPIDIIFETNSNGADMAQATINSLATAGYDTPALTKTVGFVGYEYMQIGSNHVDGNLQRGDILKTYHEAAMPIQEDALVRLNMIPKLGTPTLTEFVTPDVMSVEQIYLYP